MKYIANLCEVGFLEFSEKQFDNLQEKTIYQGNKTIKCKAITIQSYENFDYFILFPIDKFKKEQE